MSDSGFAQGLLIELDAFEIRARWGAVPDANHAQWLIEIVDPSTGILVASMSKPHLDPGKDLEQHAETFLALLLLALLDQHGQTF